MSKETTVNIDEEVLALFNKVRDKKNKIAKSERVSWNTSCSFGYNPDSLKDRINLHVVSDVGVLVDIYAFLLEKQDYYSKAASALNVKVPTQWMGYSIKKWQEDLEIRASQLQLSSERKDLATLEKRLDSLITVEQRRVMELEAIKKELGEV